MKLKYIFRTILAATVVVAASSCSQEIMDRIDTNPNSPTDVPLSLLMPQVTTNLGFAIAGTDLAWYSSVFVEHTTGVHGQLEDADKRTGINTTIGNNLWNNIYATQLINLKVIIEKGSTGGAEEGSWIHVGAAKVMTAVTLGITTDCWGRIPWSQALQGSANRTPTYDNQEFIYGEIQRLLDEAIEDLDKASVVSPGSTDLFYSGDATKWKKAAYSLKARYHNRLSKRNSSGSATAALNAAQMGFENNDDEFSFRRFQATAIGENPWFQESNDRKHHAVSVTLFDIMDNMNDPRSAIWFAPNANNDINPAPNGTAQSDQAAVLYSRASSAMVNATAHLPIMTFEELKFIVAEANLRDGNVGAANDAYEEAVISSLKKVGISDPDIAIYTAQNSVFPGAGNLTLEHIISQKYIHFWIYQPIEAFSDWRRTDIPQMTNPQPTPRRFPYPRGEFDSNAENVPSTTIQSGVWWDDGTED